MDTEMVKISKEQALIFMALLHANRDDHKLQDLSDCGYLQSINYIQYLREEIQNLAYPTTHRVEPTYCGEGIDADEVKIEFGVQTRSNIAQAILALKSPAMSYVKELEVICRDTKIFAFEDGKDLELSFGAITVSVSVNFEDGVRVVGYLKHNSEDYIESFIFDFE